MTMVTKEGGIKSGCIYSTDRQVLAFQRQHNNQCPNLVVVDASEVEIHEVDNDVNQSII